jgi:serine/threonine protein kinase
MAFNIGENIGAYRIIEQLGQGGMATVYKAYHAALDRYVALKVLHAAFHDDQTFTARFQREARVVARLEHPNIVPIYDYSEHEARPYLVMKYIEGDTLKARLNKGPLSSREIEQVVDSVGSALGYAHRQGILHRDIKPSNVLIATDGVMYLADFGLARIASAGESTLSSDSIMGTPQYISPEQAMGKKDLDAGTDIYSFAVMLYEMVVGQVPFTADTPFSIIHDHIYTPLPLPMDVNPNVPEPVQRVLLKALAKNRLDRYESVEEMIAAFKASWAEAGIPMQGTAITMRPGSLKAPTKSQPKAQSEATAAKTVAVQSAAPRRSSPWMWIGVGLVTILCIGVAFFAVWRNRSALRTPPTSVAATVVVATPLTPLPATNVPLPTLQNISPEVSAATELVTKNPGDPNAHLALSLALWDAKEIPASVQELAQASNLASPNDREFFLTAAREFKAREAWIPTAGLYMRVAPTIRNDENGPNSVRGELFEAVYKASAEKDMPLFVFFERIDNFDLPLGYVSRGRYALYNGSMEDAKAQLENAKKLKPDMYEVFLLEAEIEMKDGNNDAAKPILLSLSSDLKAPDWVRVMADTFLKTME